MSRVSGVTLLCSLSEEAEEVHLEMDNWLWSMCVRPPAMRTFTTLTDFYGGGKHPQLHSFGAGINHLDEDKFAEFILGMTWEVPENVVLIIQPENGPTRVWRPERRLI